jgi:ectoine hydrolase
MRVPAITLDFSKEEYESRIAKTRAAMEEYGVDLLITVDPSNMAWLTGYDGWSFYVHQAVLLSLDGNPIWFGRGQDAPGAKRTVFMNDEDVIEYPDHYVQSIERHPMDFLSDLLVSRSWDRKTIGVEMDNYYFSAAAFASLWKHLPNATFKDVTGLVNWQRAVKSETELTYISRAARIIEAMHAKAFELIEPGLPKNQLVAAIYQTAIAGADGHGGDYPAIAPLVPSGADAAAAHLTWDDKPFKADEGTFFEMAGCHRRYHCPMCRTIYLGKPPQKFLDAEKAVIEGIAAALEAAKPGATCHEVEAAWRAVINRHGIEKETRCGYPVGISYPPDWGERTMSIRQGDHTVLEENMTFHFIPAIWQEDWGLEITETFKVTPSGGEPFCSYPRQLFVKP